jgi:Putative adipose-regulatory protein (Seipin)
LQVDIDVRLDLPDSPENEALFQLHSYAKSDAEAVLHTARRPLSLPHRSPVVNIMRQVALFPFFLAGIMTETETLHFSLARSFTEHSEAPLAMVEVILTGARPEDPPPRVAQGALTVKVRMGASLSLPRR